MRHLRRALHRFGAAFVGGLLATMMAGSGMIALAEEVLEDAQMQDEAWFFRYRDPIEPVPPAPGELSDATEIPRATVRDQTNPYRTETLHVGLAGGDDEAMAFLGLPTTDLGFAAQITGGEVRLPISGFGGAQARTPESADMIACLAPEVVIEAHGGNWDSRYDFDCGVRGEVVLEEGSDPLTWTVDLAPFAAVWQPGDPAGIAIVPNPDTELSPPEQNWHVSFQNRHYQPAEADDPDKNPITVTLTYIEEDFPEIGGGDDIAAPPPAPTDTTASPGFTPAPPSRSAPPAAATGFAPPRPDPPPEAADGEPGPVEAAPADEAVAAQPMEPAVIRLNPLVYLLPFLAVGLAGLLGYSLTQQPVLPHAREGAVSALMRKRRIAATTTSTANA